jgi:transposase
MKSFKRHKDYGFWDQEIRLSKISRLGDLFEKLNAGINFEIFRSLLEEKLSKLSKGALSFMRFLDLTIADDIPDSRTVWHFRKQLTDLDMVEEFFLLFINELNSLGLTINEEKIIDASFVEVPVIKT